MIINYSANPFGATTGQVAVFLYEVAALGESVPVVNAGNYLMLLGLGS